MNEWMNEADLLGSLRNSSLKSFFLWQNLKGFSQNNAGVPNNNRDKHCWTKVAASQNHQ